MFFQNNESRQQSCFILPWSHKAAAWLITHGILGDAFREWGVREPRRSDPRTVRRGHARKIVPLEWGAFHVKGIEGSEVSISKVSSWASVLA